MQQQENNALQTPEASRIIAAVRAFDAKAAECQSQQKKIAEIEEIARNSKNTLAKLYGILKIDEEQLTACKQEVVDAFEAAKKAHQTPLHKNAKKKLGVKPEKSIAEEEVKTSPSDASTASQ